MLNESSLPAIASSQRESEHNPYPYTFALTEVIFLLFGVLESAIAIRMVLKLVGVNPEFPIFAMFYEFTHLLLLPFTSAVGSIFVGNMEFELSCLFAMLIYALLAWALERTAWLVFSRLRGLVLSFTQMKTHKYHTIQ